MSWTDLTFTGSHILTASDMNRLQGNFAAMAAGEAGAPPIAVNSLIVSGVASIDTLYADSAYVDFNADRIVSGTIAQARLPGIPASQTTTGIFNQARVPFEAPGPIGSTTPGTGKHTYLDLTTVKPGSPVANLQGHNLDRRLAHRGGFWGARLEWQLGEL